VTIALEFDGGVTGATVYESRARKDPQKKIRKIDALLRADRHAIAARRAETITRNVEDRDRVGAPPTAHERGHR